MYTTIYSYHPMYNSYDLWTDIIRDKMDANHYIKSSFQFVSPSTSLCENGYTFGFRLLHNKKQAINLI
jgi:hypothetical protein